MRTSYRIESPDEAEFTLTVTMKAKHWERLRAQLANAHPAWELSAAIGKLLDDARKVFWTAPGEAGDA